LTSGGNYNTVVGDEAGTAITTGDGNVALAFALTLALVYCIGRDSGADTRGNHSAAIGRNFFRLLKTLQTGEAYNTALGSSAGALVTTGVQNTLIDWSCGGCNY
jgi:autotransporter adhesin